MGTREIIGMKLVNGQNIPCRPRAINTLQVILQRTLVLKTLVSGKGLVSFKDDVSHTRHLPLAHVLSVLHLFP